MSLLGYNNIILYWNKLAMLWWFIPEDLQWTGHVEWMEKKWNAYKMENLTEGDHLEDEYGWDINPYATQYSVLVKCPCITIYC
jgi:hypothetical protein